MTECLQIQQKVLGTPLCPLCPPLLKILGPHCGWLRVWVTGVYIAVCSLGVGIGTSILSVAGNSFLDFRKLISGFPESRIRHPLRPSEIFKRATIAVSLSFVFIIGCITFQCDSFLLCRTFYCSSIRSWNDQTDLRESIGS
jgi:hypothetical protein